MNIAKKIEFVSNLGIIACCVVFAGTAWRLHSSNHAYREVSVGDQISLSDLNLTTYPRSLVLVLQTGCHFCSESAEFYRRITQVAARDSVHLVAVLPQDATASRQYLANLRLPITDIRKSSLRALRATGTPTLILVDRSGRVVKVWAGKLGHSKEDEVFREMDKRAG